jgi:hypothetical protein
MLFEAGIRRSRATHSAMKIWVEGLTLPVNLLYPGRPKCCSKFLL